MPNSYNWITPNWPAPVNVKALTTVREGGVSVLPYDSFNLAMHVGDNDEAVLTNRKKLKINAKLPQEPFWLKQTHSIRVADVADFAGQENPIVDADASVAFQANQVCAVLTADCLPILLCNQGGTRVSAIHAGWRGLAAGIIEASIQKLDCDPSTLMAWLGPAISSMAFEVQTDVLEAFQEYQSESTFKSRGNNRWFADIYQLAKERLRRLGIKAVYGGEYCTYTDSAHFYSFRRSGTTGRMATIIWFTFP